MGYSNVLGLPAVDLRGAQGQRVSAAVRVAVFAKPTLQAITVRNRAVCSVVFINAPGGGEEPDDQIALFHACHVASDLVHNAGEFVALLNLSCGFVPDCWMLGVP